MLQAGCNHGVVSVRVRRWKFLRCYASFVGTIPNLSFPDAERMNPRMPFPSRSGVENEISLPVVDAHLLCSKLTFSMLLESLSRIEEGECLNHQKSSMS